MGYLEHFIAFILIGTTFTAAEPPVDYGRSGKPSFTMQKANMVYAHSTVENEGPSSISYTNAQEPSGWKPYQNSRSSSSSSFKPIESLSETSSYEPSASLSSSSSYQPTYQHPRIAERLQNLNLEPPASTYTVHSPTFQPNIISYLQPPSSLKNTGSTYQTISPVSNFPVRKVSKSYWPPTPPSQVPDVEPALEYGPAPAPAYGPWDTSPNPSSDISEKEIRFVIHKDGEEEEVKNALSKEYQKYGDNVSFLKGPTFKFEKKQKLFLPPKPKTIIFILLRTPEVNTDTEVIPSKDDPKPEVRIVYEKPDGVKTQHYVPKVKETTDVSSSGY